MLMQKSLLNPVSFSFVSSFRFHTSLWIATMLKIGRKGEHRLSVVLSKPSGVSAPCSGTPSFARFLRACQAVSGFRAFGRVVPSA